MSDLLKVLNASYDQSLPLDARTLLKTADIPSNTSVNLKNMSPGFYYHFGVSNGIKNHYIIENSHINEPIKLVVGIDGLPLTKKVLKARFGRFYAIFVRIHILLCFQLDYIGAMRNHKKVMIIYLILLTI